MQLPLVLDLIAQHDGQALVLVGIGGHGASGKTTLALAIVQARSGVPTQVVSTDEFWNGSHFDLERLRASVVEPLRDGRVAEYESWNWADKISAGTRRITPTGVVIVEGVCALHAMFRAHYDVRIWVDTPYDTRVARGVARDGEAMRSAWTDVWIPNEEAYVARDEPRACAQLTIDGTKPY